MKSLSSEEEDKDTRKWKDILGSCIGTINIMKMTILPKVIYRFNTKQSKSPSHSSQKNRKKNCPKIHMELEKTQAS